MTIERVKSKNNWRYHWHAIMTLADRSSQSTFWGLGIFITITLTLLTSALVLHNSLRFTERNIIYIASQPLFFPIYVNTGLVSLYLAIIAAVAASRERDRGTLEVLFYGPIDEMVFILGLFLAQLQVFLVAILVTVVWLNLVTWLLHLAFSIEIYIILITSIIMAGAVIAFGLLTAVWGGRTRTALMYFLLVLMLLAGLQIADQVISGLVLVTNPTMNDPILVIRNTLVVVSGVIQWVSPYSQLNQTMEAVTLHNLFSYLLHLGVILLQMLVLLLGSIFILRRKGVRG
jgi:ABC-type transport system involved in multi-copper enzyme maturation permease subunit